jgi:glucose/arabinose dehydrogenase
MKRWRTSVWLCAGLVMLLGLVLRVDPGAAGEQELQEKALVGHLVKPAHRDFDPSLVEQLQVPSGFRVNVLAQGLGKPRMMAVAEDGTVYVTRPESDDVLALRDSDGDGRADEPRTVVADLKKVHGIAIHHHRLYLAAPRELFVADLRPDRTIAAPQLIMGDLPDGGQHPNRTLAFGPDGMLYISVGSSCNACRETNEEHATVLRAQPDGRQRTIYARGLRNTIGFDWHPETGELWGMDHGSDWRGDEQPPEELNRLQQGENYGWPWRKTAHCWFPTTQTARSIACHT